MSTTLEIERKFLVRHRDWKTGLKGKAIAQGYIINDKSKGVVVRVRTKGDKSFLTIKAEHAENVRLEYEYEIPRAHCQSMLQNLCGAPIEKTRYEIDFGGLTWEVDEFHGVNEGLVMAEIELSSVDQVFVMPDWIGPEVSDDKRFFNSYISENPFSTWGVSPDELFMEIENKKKI